MNLDATSLSGNLLQRWLTSALPPLMFSGCCCYCRSFLGCYMSGLQLIHYMNDQRSPIKVIVGSTQSGLRYNILIPTTVSDTHFPKSKWSPSYFLAFLSSESTYTWKGARETLDTSRLAATQHLLLPLH